MTVYPADEPRRGPSGIRPEPFLAPAAREWSAAEPEAVPVTPARIAEEERAAAEAAAAAELSLAFAPIHKRAFGIAVGCAVSLLMGALTLFHLVLDPENAPNLPLLANYFYGYRVTWAGLVVGMFWGFVVGFVGGWFVAFCRNIVIALSVFVSRTRAELAQTRDFLDHI
jgi:hypothetical protein